MGAEAISPVDQHDGLGDPLKIHGPVECRVAPSDEQDPLALELLRIQHLEVESLLLELVLTFDPQPPGLERPDTGRDHDGPGGIVSL